MLESFWKKELSDGLVELGTDSMIHNKEASWTRGRQDIISVQLTFNRSFIHLISRLEGPSSSWDQQDGYCFSANKGQSFRISRSISCSINDNNYLLETKHPLGFRLELNKKKGIPIPEGVSSIVCSIDINGRVVYTWR
jgi:hypothetical protein